MRASSVVCTKHDKLEPQAESSPHRDLLEEEAGRRTPPVRHRDSWPFVPARFNDLTTRPILQPTSAGSQDESTRHQVRRDAIDGATFRGTQRALRGVDELLDHGR